MCYLGAETVVGPRQLSEKNTHYWGGGRGGGSGGGSGGGMLAYNSQVTIHS